MKIKVKVVITEAGFDVYLNQHPHQVSYPKPIWQAFPQKLKLPFAEFVAFMTTVPKAFTNSTNIEYQFPRPIAESFFYFGLLLSQPENLIDFSGWKTSDYLRQVMNSFYKISFIGQTREIITDVSYTPDKQSAIVPFTFGKDSLLTFGLCQEMGLKPIPIFMLEPTNLYENKLKQKLLAQFIKEFKQPIYTFPVPLAQLKQTRGKWWGWDIFLTQYTIFLLPFLYTHKANYLFWSNESNCNEVVSDSEGFMVNATFEQSTKWMQVLSSGLRLFGVNAKLGSLLEPLTEIGILSMLHRYYPDLGRYQTSCLNDEPISATKRWCGKCYECARVYISLLALRIDPRRVGFDVDMLRRSKRHLYYIFAKTQDDLHNKFTFTRNEKLFAFFLAYKNGSRGKLLDEFKTRFLKNVKAKQKHYRHLYLGTSSTQTIPEELKSRVHRLYSQRLDQIKKDLEPV